MKPIRSAIIEERDALLARAEKAELEARKFRALFSNAIDTLELQGGWEGIVRAGRRALGEPSDES